MAWARMYLTHHSQASLGTLISGFHCIIVRVLSLGSGVYSWTWRILWLGWNDSAASQDLFMVSTLFSIKLFLNVSKTL